MDCRATTAIVAALFGFAACSSPAESPFAPPATHGPFATSVLGPLGTPWPAATDEQKKTFERGLEVAKHRWSRAEGLGPSFNLTFCGGCHEKPVFGGSSGLYRNFFLAGIKGSDGSYTAATSAGKSGGVLRLYSYLPGQPSRPPVDPKINVLAQRNSIPFFGAGLLAELPGAEIAKRADPDDRNHDGISGRANYDRGFVGRFGRKSQTVSIEGFIRGPLFNHVGITTDPLSEEQRAKLPVDSSAKKVGQVLRSELAWLQTHAQAAAPDGPTLDDDGAPDPEMTTAQLYDLVSFAMLMAGPLPEAETAQIIRGRNHFDVLGCSACHTPRLVGPHGPLPVYSDLLLHDMGPELADGVEMNLAKGNEFRTQPLWGIVADGPYLHDGRATTLREAVLMHAGEAAKSRDQAGKLSDAQFEDLLEFMRSLGGRSQASAGMLPPNAQVPAVGVLGGPRRQLLAEEQQQFVRGRAAFDRDHGFAVGAGAPRLNGDSCRACHFEPILGGSGPRDVNVMRHGLLGANGQFLVPAIGTVLHRTTALVGSANAPEPAAKIFEMRQTPHLFGMGLLDAVPDAEIASRADPTDSNGDGIAGRVSWVDGGRVGRLGWKAQVPSIAEFVRDAFSTEIGLTVPYVKGFTYGVLQDDDGVADPEAAQGDADDVAFFLRELAPPPRTSTDPVAEAAGEKLFASAGCATCHTPQLQSALGPVPAYTDLLLHAILPKDSKGIEEFSAGMRDFRTAPLWGLATTGPYWHTGEADTIEQALLLHDGEALKSKGNYQALSAADRKALLAFLGSL